LLLRFAVSALVFILLAVGVTNTALAQRQTGTITGRVIADDGQPIAHAKITISGVGGVKKMMSGRMLIVTDESGGFQADGLDPAPYSISATAPGYVLMPNEKAGGQPGIGGSKYAHVGENVTIRMIRGGVITGRVTNAMGEPIIGIPVEMTRVRDENGKAVSGELTMNDLSANRQTDDRGIYRIYGLAPGSYFVSAGSGALGFSPRPTPFSGRMKIYYPSATRDTAVEVGVRSGEEASGIDIRYRSERGFAISGKVLGVPNPQDGVSAMATTIVSLTKPGTDIVLATAMVSPIAGGNSYAFYGLPNGEYEATATLANMNDLSSFVSAPRKVSLNGRDVTGFDLTLAPTASISGTVALEKLAAAGDQTCEPARESFLDELVLKAKPENPYEKPVTRMPWWGTFGAVAPDDKGVYALTGLNAGRHFIESQLPNEHWYIKAITLTSAPASAASLRNAGSNGVTLKSGEKVSGLTITIAEGAAGLKGKIALSGNGRLPAQLRVHLLPAEAESKDDVLRFAETRAEADGSFSFSNLAPGKYLLLARPVPEAESTDKPPAPLAWNIAERAKLRKEAEASNQSVGLKTCQHVSDFVLQFSK